MFICFCFLLLSFSFFFYSLFNLFFTYCCNSKAVDPRSVKILLYCSNRILPNEKLGRIEIPKHQFGKGRTVAKQVHIEPHGDLSLNIHSGEEREGKEI